MSDSIYQLYASGMHYDSIYERFGPSEEVAFYCDLAVQTGGTILELACGTGRLTVPLAQAGFQVAGIDTADSMLDEAREKATAEGLDLQLANDDIRSFRLEDRFGLVFLPSNAICHLMTRSDFEATISCVKNHLQPDGRFVIDVFVPAAELLVDRGDERLPYSEYEALDGSGHVVLTHCYRYDWHTQIKHIRTYYSFADGHEDAGTLDMRMYYPQELDALLEYNGLCIVDKYGAFDRRPFGPETGQQLIVCSLQETSA